jgi:spore coat-associated protein N
LKGELNKLKKFMIASLAMILALGLMGGAFAYFSDTETSNGNTFTAGTLDLKVNGGDDPVVHIISTDLKPYPHWSHSYGGQWSLTNAGSIPGRFSMEIKNIKNYENGLTEPEIQSGDTTGGALEGELGGLLFVKWSRNVDPWGGWGPVFDPLNSAEGVIVQGDILAPGETAPAVYLDVEFDTHAGLIDNTAQGDSVEFDIVFHLDQVP